MEQPAGKVSMLVICPWYLGGSPTPPLITSPTIGKLDETGPHFHIKGCDSVEFGNFDECADSGESGHSGKSGNILQMADNDGKSEAITH